MNWNRTNLSLCALVLACLSGAQTLYAGTTPASTQGLDFRSWGSGSAKGTEDAAFDGTLSVRISSRNFYQGGIMVFEKPVDLAGAFGDKANLLRFAVKLPLKPATGGSGGALGGGKGGAIGAGGDGPSTGGTASGSGGALAGGEGGGAAASGSDLPALTKLRLVLTTSDGKKSEAMLDVSTSLADNRGWSQVGIPLASISGFDRTNKSITSIAMSCDALATIYVGEVKILNDPTPVYGTPNHVELNLAIGDEITFRGSGSAGTTPALFAWDFDESDGVQVDAEGAVVRRKFRKAGSYVVTMITKDAYGLKPPHMSKIRVTVNP
ncbi:MAG: PKD domain-containing protein [Fimbriimonadaceae bacterium]